MACIIYCEKDAKKLISKPSLESVQELLERTQERASYKNKTVIDFANRTRDLTALELFVKNYRERCYSSFAIIGKVESAQKHFHESIEIGEY